jgi:hypothetical protein
VTGQSGGPGIFIAGGVLLALFIAAITLYAFAGAAR